MPTTLSEASIELVSRIIRNHFHALPDEMHNDDEMYQLIHTAGEFGLHDLVTELVNSFPHEYQEIEIKKQIRSLMLLKSA